MRRGAAHAAVAVLLSLAPLAAGAQSGATGVRFAAASQRAASTGAMVGGGLAGAAAGLTVGIVAGNAVDRARGYDGDRCPDCTRWGAGIGGSVGTTLGVALGAHLANGRRGRLSTVLLRTAAAMAPFWVASYAASEGWDMLAVFAAVGSGVYVAQRTERRTMPGSTASRSSP